MMIQKLLFVFFLHAFTGCTYHFLENTGKEPKSVMVMHNYTDTLPYITRKLKALENAGYVSNVHFVKNDSLYQWTFHLLGEKTMTLKSFISGTFTFNARPNSRLSVSTMSQGDEKRDTLLLMVDREPVIRKADEETFFWYKKHRIKL